MTSVLLIACGGQPAGVSPSPVASTVIPSLTPSASAFAQLDRAKVIERVAGLSAEVRRIDYDDAALVRWSDFESLANTATRGVDDRMVWVVAISGEITPQFARGDRFASAMFIVDARTNDVLGVTAQGFAWPNVYGMLVDGITGSRRPEPRIDVPAGSGASKNVSCGNLQPGSIATGEGSGADDLRPAVGAVDGVRPLFRFGQPASARAAYGTYVCVRYTLGVPSAGFIAYVQPGDADYLPSSSLVPTGFTLPAACRYVGEPTTEIQADQVLWKVDCGVSASGSVREAFARAAAAQGWRDRGQGPTSLSWSKGGRTIAIEEPSGSADTEARLTLRPTVISPP